MKKNLKIAITGLALMMASESYAQTDGRVGVNTATPTTTLDVRGKTDSSGNLLTTDVTGLQAPRLTRGELTAKGSLYGVDQRGTLIYITDVSSGDALGTSPRKNIDSVGYYYFDGSVWQKITNLAIEPWNNVATGTPATANTQNIYQMGNVGIGTAAPTEKLNVHDGNIFVTESTDLTSSLLKYGSMELYRDKTSPVGNVNGYVDFKDAKNDDYDARIYYNSAFGTKGGFTVALSTDGTPATGLHALTILNENGNVGISNNTPVARLDIVAPSPGTGIKIADGSQGAGKVLTSDANGVGTWVENATSSSNFATRTYFTNLNTIPARTYDVNGVGYTKYMTLKFPSAGKYLIGVGGYFSPQGGAYRGVYAVLVRGNTTSAANTPISLFEFTAGGDPTGSLVYNSLLFNQIVSVSKDEELSVFVAGRINSDLTVYLTDNFAPWYGIKLSN